jgi:arginine/lysine/ornithine decarboxylase
MLLVDNAHGAYLKFVTPSMHPMDLGADMCCDSAHKTLPVLTGGAYLHISDQAPKIFTRLAKQALAMFGSTSPSYLILQSLDAVNRYLVHTYPEQLRTFLPLCNQAKVELAAHGYSFVGNEILKWTIDCKSYGYTGIQLAQQLKESNIHVEFSDPDYLVLMFTPEIGIDGLTRLQTTLIGIPSRSPIVNSPPAPVIGVPILTPRQAALSPSEIIPVKESFGRILSAPSVGCPPAVPIIVCGEQIDANTIECFQYYGIEACCVTIP